MRAHGAKNKFCMVIKQNERKIFKVRPQSTSSALDNFCDTKTTITETLYVCGS